MCFFSSKREKTQNRKKKKREKAPGSTVWRSHRSHRSWHRNILYTRRDWRSLGNRGGCQKGAEKHAGLQFGINVKGLAIHSRTGKKEEEEKKEKNQAQETCPEIKRECWREQDVLQDKKKERNNDILYIYLFLQRAAGLTDALSDSKENEEQIKPRSKVRMH